MLDAILRPQDRGSFFGTMRYSYMLVSGAIFYLFGKLMGKEPPLWMMQAMVIGSGVLILGRMYCMLKVPVDRSERPAALDLRTALGTAVKNGPLTSYAVYACLLTIAYSTLQPLTLVYLKNGVDLASGKVQVFSTIGIAGGIAGYFVYGYLFKLLKIKKMELATHALFIAVPLTLFFVGPNCGGFLWIVGAAYFAGAFAEALFKCNNSTEIMALASPGNKPMVSAFVQTYQNLGNGFSRSCSALVLGSSMLSTEWSFRGASVTIYHTIFLVCGVVAVLILILLPTLPSVTPDRRDYYDPVC